MNLAGREPKIRGVLLRNVGKADAKRPKQQLRLFHLLIGDSRRQQHLREAIFTAVFDGGKPHQAAKRLDDGDEQRGNARADDVAALLRTAGRSIEGNTRDASGSVLKKHSARH